MEAGLQVLLNKQADGQHVRHGERKKVFKKLNDYRMLCPALPAGRCKKCVNVSKNIRPFLSCQGHYIGRKIPPLHPPARQGQNVGRNIKKTRCFVPSENVIYFCSFLFILRT